MKRRTIVVGITTVLTSGCIGVNPAWDGADGGTGAGSGGDSSGAAGTQGALDTEGAETDGESATGLNEDGSGSTSEGSDTSGDASEDWWGPDWSFRRRLRLDNSAQAEALSGFPVRVDFSAASFDYESVAPDGADLRFVDRDGTTTLPHEIERWAPSGDSVVWVRVDDIAAAAEDHIWLYYGGDAVDTQDAAATWEGYELVMHLDETTGPHVDSAHAIECAWNGPPPGQDAQGRAAGANHFNGNGAVVDCGDTPTHDSGDSTLTVWARLELTGDESQELIAYEALSTPYEGLGLVVRRDDGALGKWLDGSVHYAGDRAQRVTADEWAFLAIRGHADPREGYVQLSKDAGPWEVLAMGDTENLRVEPDTPLSIGAWLGPGPDSNTRGILDEVRLSPVERSDAWIAAQFLSQSSAFVTMDREEAR